MSWLCAQASKEKNKSRPPPLSLCPSASPGFCFCICKMGTVTGAAWLQNFRKMACPRGCSSQVEGHCTTQDSHTKQESTCPAVVQPSHAALAQHALGFVPSAPKK